MALLPALTIQMPLLHNIRGVSKQLSVSVLNQVVGSGANFALGLYLIRTLTPNEFGLYGIGMAACLWFAGFGNALFLTQMVVHYPDKHNNDRQSYTASMLALVCLFSLTTIILSGILYAVMLTAKWPNANVTNLVLATIAASIANLLKNYFIRLAYTINQEHKALIVNAFGAFALFLLVVMLHADNWISDAPSALWVFATANFTGAIVGFFITNTHFQDLCLRRIRRDFSEALVGGKWALGGVTVTWIQSQSYMYAATIIVGPIGVAMANAARMLIAPFTFILPALTQLILPRLAELRNLDKLKMHSTSQIYTTLMVGAGALYLLTLFFSAGYVIPLVVGNRYSLEQVFPLVYAWGVVLLFQLIRDGASLTLQALRAFRHLMLTNTLTAAVVVAVTFILSAKYGVPGAILGVGVGDFLLAVLLWSKILTDRK